jgi:hypothetical protein
MPVVQRVSEDLGDEEWERTHEFGSVYHGGNDVFRAPDTLIERPAMELLPGRTLWSFHWYCCYGRSCGCC